MDPLWREASTIGGVGFGLVFAVLIILALIIWITGKLLHRYDWAREEVIKLEQAKASDDTAAGKD